MSDLGRGADNEKDDEEEEEEEEEDEEEEEEEENGEYLPGTRKSRRTDMAGKLSSVADS